MTKVLWSIVLIGVVLVVLALLPTPAAQPQQPQQTASASCVGLFVIGSCNVTETTTLAQPERAEADGIDAASRALVAVLLTLVVLVGMAALIMVLTRDGGEVTP